MSVQICHSETEAKTKWCPFARVSWNALDEPYRAPVPVSISRMPRPTGQANCLGSGCMAWRWVETNVNGPMGEDGAPGDLVPSGDTHGYCGLAGVPGAAR